MSGLGVQSAQPRSPGAARSGTRAWWSTPPELREEMLLSAQVPLDSWTPANPSCMYDWKVVVAATPMTSGLVEGEPDVPLVPASPVLETTVTPAATAASSASAIGSSSVSGNGLPPNDSFNTSTPATSTA